MQVLLVLLSSSFLLRLLGTMGVPLFETWLRSARVALAIMFVFTAIGHFAAMKKDLIAMVVRAVQVEGLLELATPLLNPRSVIV